MKRAAWLLAACAAWLSGPAAAQNLLLNPDFPTGDVSQWTVESSVSVAWSDVDALGTTGSGSIMVTNASPGPSNGTGISQCGGSVTAGKLYDWGGRVYYPGGQSRTGNIQIGLRWYDAPACGGTTLDQPRQSASIPGGWTNLQVTNEVAPPGARSVEFLAFPSKVEAGGTLVAHFDELYFGPSGTTSTNLSQGRVRVTVEWKSPYSGQNGRAYAIPQQDGFAFFYFTDPGNPEVFVKVLDFGQGGALCFVGGLSDFFYRVTFTVVRTGQELSFEKAAKVFVGFADNGTLRFGRPGAPGASSNVNTADARPVLAGFLPLGEAPARAGVSAAAAAQSLTLSQGRVEVSVEWRSQYSGQSGMAFATPQQDRFGFFYFTDAGNPEVFVKVLDFGGGGALCFVGGLSDFFYRVTFKTLRTGQTLVFEKPAGLYVGFADNGALRF